MYSNVQFDYICCREDFNSLAAGGKATLIFKCLQYVIDKVRKVCFEERRKRIYGGVEESDQARGGRR